MPLASAATVWSSFLNFFTGGSSGAGRLDESSVKASASGVWADSDVVIESLVISSSDLSRESSSIVSWWPLDGGNGSGLLSSDVGSNCNTII